MQTIIQSESDTITRINQNGKEIIIIGTAHVSSDSVVEVREVIDRESPDRICIEIDESRFESLMNPTSWENMDIVKVIKEKKGFLLLANLVLASFQKKIGSEFGVKPGQEMMQAVQIAKDKDVPFSLCDREIQVTLRRAWAKSGLWNKMKLISSLIASAFTNEEVSEKDIEELKQKTALQGMMDELSDYLPSVKEVLIDERDRFLASRIFTAAGDKKVAVVGAGHVPGMLKWIEKLGEGDVSSDVDDINNVPASGKFAKSLPWILPVIIICLIGSGFFMSGKEAGIKMVIGWVLANGTLSALGALLALAHPLVIIFSFLAAPLTSLNPTIGVGIFTGILQGSLRKPLVKDFEHLNEDMLNLKGWYRNRITHVLLVFFLSSIGSSIGTFIALPWIMALFA